MKYRCLWLVLVVFLAVPALVRGQLPACTVSGQVVTIAEVPEGPDETTVCLAPFALPATTPLLQFDLIEANPIDPFLPVSDYLDIVTDPAQGGTVVILQSDDLETGLPARFTVACNFPTVFTNCFVREVPLPGGGDGATITVTDASGVIWTLNVISDSGPEVPEPASMLLFGSALVGVGLLLRCRNRAR